MMLDILSKVVLLIFFILFWTGFVYITSRMWYTGKDHAMLSGISYINKKVKQALKQGQKKEAANG